MILVDVFCPELIMLNVSLLLTNFYLVNVSVAGGNIFCLICFPLLLTKFWSDKILILLNRFSIQITGL